MRSTDRLVVVRSRRPGHDFSTDGKRTGRNPYGSKRRSEETRVVGKKDQMVIGSVIRGWAIVAKSPGDISARGWDEVGGKESEVKVNVERTSAEARSSEDRD